MGELGKNNKTISTTREGRFVLVKSLVKLSILTFAVVAVSFAINFDRKIDYGYSSSLSTVPISVPTKKVTNILSKDYAWVGNRWIPPSGVQYFSPNDIQLIFKSENTLWMGDSTSRQDYHTMYSMMNAENIQNILVEELNRNINKGKGKHGTMNEGKGFKKNFYCPNRNIASGTSAVFWGDLGQVAGTNCTGHNSLSSTEGIGKFDLKWDQGCLKELIPMLQNYTSVFQREYTVMIITTGIWDTILNKKCAVKGNRTETPSDRVIKTLNILKMISSPSLYIIWKTHGPGNTEDNQSATSLKMTKTAQNWFSINKPLHMGLSDFGFVVTNGDRTFSPNRIAGDMNPHWGLEARTLSIQMATNLVYMKQTEHKINGF